MEWISKHSKQFEINRLVNIFACAGGFFGPSQAQTFAQTARTALVGPLDATRYEPEPLFRRPSGSSLRASPSSRGLLLAHSASGELSRPSTPNSAASGSSGVASRPGSGRPTSGRGRLGERPAGPLAIRLLRAFDLDEDGIVTADDMAVYGGLLAKVCLVSGWQRQGG